eukprot:TRINITY_DN23538_c0_g1_i1.p1 TRINITY_DN23538_c0_g1~~TRINITY_DN23538_c0_g1_i1.p1  ORF type:complete len:598 (-),score=118.03 TRINITY_DN23538_c0_g1_i1:79-1872(-)
MPTVNVGRDLLFQCLGKTYTKEEFDELCFEFGIELDDVTTEKAMIRKEKHLDEEASADEEVIYKIEVPANRYDLLCLEGLARALRIFLGNEEVPNFSLAPLGSRKPERLVVKPETVLIRPFVVCAILRNVTFDQTRYQSFIDLQDRLHQNLCRRRTLVAIGTHDLDTLQGPFSYEALCPTEIHFTPLKQQREFTAAELMEFYKSDNKLKKFLGIINDSPVFPVIYDSKRTVLSLPPIINGAHSAITLATKNVFIECTATDLTKANVVLNTMVTMFSEYCEDKFVIEPVEVVAADGTSCMYPDLSFRTVETDADYVNSHVGISLRAAQMVDLLNRMQLPAEVVSGKEGGDSIRVMIPPTRSDVLHACDVMEDVAIAYGYNNITRTVPRCATVAKEIGINHFSDLLRQEVAMAGFTEVLTWVLCSLEENFKMVNRANDGLTAAVIGNPRSSDFEVVRSSLLPGVLKTVGHNKEAPRPVKVFEVSDIVLLDQTTDVGARNHRRLVALYCGSTSGFEVIHGLVDRVMEVVGATMVPRRTNGGYYITPSQSPEFFEGRQADVIYRGKRVGTFGVIHPQVLECFDIPDPCSALEIDIQPFLLP